jgi:hypothetical protein
MSSVMRRLRALIVLAAPILLLVPALAGAAAGCAPKGCPQQAPRAHDCCPPAPASLLPGCCETATPAKVPQPTVSPDRHLLLAAAAPVALPIPPAAPLALASVDEAAPSAASAPLHAVLRL